MLHVLQPWMMLSRGKTKRDFSMEWLTVREDNMIAPWRQFSARSVWRAITLIRILFKVTKTAITLWKLNKFETCFILKNNNITFRKKNENDKFKVQKPTNDQIARKCRRKHWGSFKWFIFWLRSLTYNTLSSFSQP